MGTANPSDSFPSFPKLPLEIQSKIWSNALTPRTIAVEPKYVGHTPPGTPGIWTDWEVRIRATPIPILQVCHVARAEVLRRYTKLGNDDDAAAIYIDFSCDTLYLAWTHTRPLDLCFRIAAAFFYHHRKKVRSLAIDIFYLANGVCEALVELEDFHSLQDLVFVAPRPRDCLDKPWSERSGIVLKDIEAPYHSNHIEFDILFEIVCTFYKKFPGICNSAYLAECHEVPNQLTGHLRHSPDGDVFDIERAERLSGSAAPRYTWFRE
ncbi:hypothetical protein BDZ45DRAFT_739034 [Acephala macrosclerotiorum]|nr:hypothetical protein BDZ45DRAFT_739034 [Acephala macrosclerotiorum]